MSPMEKCQIAGELIRQAGEAMEGEDWKMATFFLYNASKLLALSIQEIEQQWRRAAWQWCVN